MNTGEIIQNIFPYITIFSLIPLNSCDIETVLVFKMENCLLKPEY